MKDDANLSELAPCEVLETSSLTTYEELRDLTRKELLRLRSYLFILDKLLDFPSDPSYLFLGPEQQTFLELAKISFTESSILIITKLATDTGKDLLSMPRFKNWIRQHVKQEYQKAFDQLCIEHKFSDTVRTLQQEFRGIRDNPIAHLIVDNNLQPKASIDGVPFHELHLITSELNKLFDVLCLGDKYSTLPLEYEPSLQHPAGKDPRSDIEYFLDLIIQDSHLFNVPEKSPYWQIEKETLSPDIVSILNKYRRKFGKPEV